MNISRETIDLVMGLLFVVFYSGHNFNTPATNRSSTTAARYFLALSIYLLGAALAYFTLVNFPHLLTFLAHGGETTDADAGLPPWASELSIPLIVALMMTVLLPKLPVLGTADKWICAQLQHLAAIPSEVLRLSAELRKLKFEVSPQVQAQVREKLVDEGFEGADIRFGDDDEPVQKWARLSALFLRLEAWDSDRRMSDYLLSWGERLEKLRQRREALVPKARFCFDLLHQMAAEEDPHGMHEVARHVAEDFSEQVTHLHHDLLDFISRGILHAELTDTSRRSRLMALGIIESPQAPSFSLNQTMCLFFIVGVVMLSSFMLLTPHSSNVSQGVIIVRTIMISVIYSVAVACVVIPRQRWSIAKAEPGMRPFAFYALAGLMAVVFSQAISLAFNCILERGLASGWERCGLTYPWAVVTFTTAVVTGFLIDNRPARGLSRRAWRGIEGLIACIVMLGAACVTHTWLVDLVDGSPEVVRRLGYVVPPLFAVLVTAGVVGFFIGLLVPTWCRDAAGQQNQAPAPPLPAALCEAHAGAH